MILHGISCFFESWNETRMISHQLNTPAYTAPADCHHVGKPMAHREEDRRTYGDIKQKKSKFQQVGQTHLAKRVTHVFCTVAVAPICSYPQGTA